MTTTASNTTLPALPWDLTGLTAPKPGISSGLSDSGYHLSLIQEDSVLKTLSQFTEVYSAAIVIESITQRPVSSDYDPYGLATIRIVLAGRDKSGNYRSDWGVILATLSHDIYPSTQSVNELRDAAESIVKSDSPLSRWWHGLLKSITLVEGDAREAARTAVILNLVENARVDIKNRPYDNPRKGMAVKVVRGRKVPIGTEGKLIWVGMTKFGKRVGFKDAKDEVVWTAWENIEFTDKVVEDEVLAEAKKQYADKWAKVFGPARN